ncbi:MAG: HDOD domain-containing protein [Candidatus Eisenbacteria bacterium]|uniref:HDOD domain-containing protein n=1 Tax=Eiseniibacteriota bacterium TaxID=2212470 RepID=A0A933SH66_UNCEI|nr:HDOD domain-containing protein [Candidatus Eisenbacteria bacterium]
MRVLVGVQGADENALRALRIAHRAVPEPVEIHTLLEAIRRTLLLRELVSNDAVRDLLGKIGKLPPVPSVYARLTTRLEDPSVSVFELGRIVAEDPALSAQVLKIANSAYFSHGTPVTQIAAAAARLGTRLLRSLVLTAEVYSRLPISPFMVERLERLQKHSSLVARIASTLEPGVAWKDDAFTAGLLHDVGKLLMASQEPALHEQIVVEAESTGRCEHEVEMERLGAHHGTLGACLLGMWGLPSPILEAVRGHHDVPLVLPTPLTPGSAVALGDLLAHATDPDPTGTSQSAPGLPAAMRDPRWPVWFEQARSLSDSAIAS